MSEIIERQHRFEADQGTGLPEIGQWYWVPVEEGDGKIPDGPGGEFLCVTYVGSNYATMTDIFGNGRRMHLDELDKRGTRELDPARVISMRSADYRAAVQEKMDEVRRITAALGVTPHRRISGQDTETAGALIVSGGADFDGYKKQLIRAKTKQLPALFKEIEGLHKLLKGWMKATSLPMRAEAKRLEESIAVIDDRLFSVSLYAGLVENVKLVRKGEPALVNDKLHVMQRQCYMDEECLVNYQTGGMEFRDIKQFDAWLAKKENFERILPHPRCLVTFRVRRHVKERHARSLADAFINFELAKQDQYTFLYIRNGQQLYRLDTEIEFGSELFPSQTEFDMTKPMWAKFDWREKGPVEIITEDDYLIRKAKWEERLRKQEEARKLHKAWCKQHLTKAAKKKGLHEWDSPYERAANDHFSWTERAMEGWEPFNETSVRYDDIMKNISEQIRSYNRISLIIQGLFDRSMVLHPHLPAKTWTPEGFEQVIALVRDRDHALHHGDPPDFDRYRTQCNDKLAVGSITIGQDKYWRREEAKKENERRKRRGRYRDYDRDLDEFEPHDDRGPGFIARVMAWSKRLRRARYDWIKQRVRNRWRRTEYVQEVPKSISVPEAFLFNISAYTPGDYKQFYVDPRTRAQYLQWAGTLLTAEEFHAGNLQLNESPYEWRKRRRKAEKPPEGGRKAKRKRRQKP